RKLWQSNIKNIRFMACNFILIQSERKSEMKSFNTFYNILKGEIKMKEALQKLTEGKGLSLEESIHVANKLFVNETTEIEIASLLIALKAKGESVDEIAGLVQAVRQHATTFTTLPFPVMDNCGTGGDGSQSFNISTTAAFVIAGAGIPIAKHGNR